MNITTHPHVKVIEGMTAAAISGDKDALAKIFTDDMQFHVRGPRSETTTASTASPT